LKNIGEIDDGIFDWMLINNGKGWEAGNVRHQFPSLTRVATECLQTPASLLAQAHATANVPHTPRHRETRRPRPQPTDGSAPSTPLVSAPTPAHVKSSTRRPGTREGHGSRDPGARADISVQPIAPVSRRASQTPRETSGLAPPHPYATAPTSSGYRTSNGFGRHSPIPGSHAANVTNGNILVGRNEASDPFIYGAQVHAAKNLTNSREDTTAGTLTRDTPQMRGMAAFDTQRSGVDEMDDDRHPKRRGFFSGLFCCRA
jgi:casein kinase 1